MKNLLLIIATSILLTLKMVAQTPPPTPETPVKSTSYSISISGDVDDEHFSGTSVSIKKTDDTYKFTASFSKNRTGDLRAALLEQLGKDGLQIKGNTYTWTKRKSGDEVFECKLTKGNLRITVDRETLSTKIYEQVVDLGLNLKDLIAGTDHNEDTKKDKERAERDLERAKRDLERAQKELERVSKG